MTAKMHLTSDTPEGEADECSRMAERFHQTGHVHVPVDFDGVARAYVFALVPNFSMHSFSAALEPLRIANQLAGQALFHWETRSVDGKPVQASNGLSLSSDGTFTDLPKGAVVLACSGDNAQMHTPKPLSDWLRWAWRRGHIVGGVCTGAHALCQAGLLSDHSFTLHWECQPSFSELYPDLPLDPAAFVVDRRIVTSGGGVASTDLMLHLIQKEFGRNLRYAVADMCLQLHVRGPQDMQRSAVAKAFGLQNPKLIRAIEFVQANLQGGFNVDDWAEHLAISRRQLERLFKAHTGVTPKSFAQNLRLEHAYSLLVGTDLTLVEVAEATGFSSGNFSKVFKHRFGVQPRQLTRQIG